MLLSASICERPQLLERAAEQARDLHLGDAHPLRDLGLREILDETHVKALALVQGTPVILYYLVHETGGWKIGLKQGGES